MKQMKRIFALALAVMMVMSLAITASADTVDVSNHTFVAYQIFSGSQATDGGALGNVKWGSGVSEEDIMEALSKTDAFKDCKDAAEVAAELSKYEGTSDVAKEFARIAYANKAGEGTVVKDGDSIAAGYYLIVDTTNVSGKDDVLNLALLEVSTTITIESKVEKPSSEKKVKDTNDSTSETSGWQDSADYDINDPVPFQLKATLPGDLDNYKTYYLAFHDSESDGLDFNPGSVKVYVDGNLITSGYQVITAGTCNSACTFEVIFTNVKAIPGVHAKSVITVEYTSTLNEGAVLGSVGNPNLMHIEYSNNPNWEGEGKPDDTGKTPDDKVIVFTYKVIVDKINEAGTALPGAGFTLFKKNSAGTYVPIGEEPTGEAMTTFEWKGLDDGDYKLEETTTPAGYNTIAPIVFTVSATHDPESADPKLTDLTGNVTSGEVTFTTNATEGSLSTDVVNKSGAVLPETGGIGTTIFYVAGGLMVLFAVILLVTKKRMATAE